MRDYTCAHNRQPGAFFHICDTPRVSLELVTDHRGESVLYVYLDGQFAKQVFGRAERLREFATTEYPAASLHEINLGEAVAA